MTITLQVGCLHTEKISFMVLKTAEVIMCQLQLSLQTSITVNSSSIESPESQQEVEIPHKHCPICGSLPQNFHHSGNGTVLLTFCLGRFYLKEGSILCSKTTEVYIKETLTRGFIRPLTSPATSSFFFVAKSM